MKQFTLKRSYCSYYIVLIVISLNFGAYLKFCKKFLSYDKINDKNDITI